MAIRDYDRLFIGGDWVAPEGADTIGVISPVSEEIIARVPDGTEADIDKAVAAARIAFDRGPWPRMDPAERGEILRKAAAQIMAETADLAEIITREMGAPITFSNLGQVMAPMMIFNYYADLAGTFAFDEVRDGVLNPKVLVTKEPVGVVGRSPRGTCRSSSRPPSWRRRWPPAARSSTSRHRRRRSTRSAWPRSLKSAGCPRACSRWSRRAARCPSTS